MFGNDQDGSTSARNVLIENSVFVCCYDGFIGGRQRNEPGDNIVGLFGDHDPESFVFRFNTVWCANGCGFKLTDGTGADAGRDASIVVDSNVFGVLSPVTCDIGTITWRDNVAKEGTGCDGGTLADPAFVAEPATEEGGLKLVEGSFDLRLRPGSPAIGAGNQTDFPATDIEGKRRVAGRVDAGAYQTG